MPTKHAFQYIDRLEPAFTPLALPFGRAFHAAVGEHLVSDASLGEVQQIFRDMLTREIEAGLAPVLFDDQETLGFVLDTGARMLEAFSASVPRPQTVIGVEVAFSLELVDPGTSEPLPVPFIGAIDAVVIEDGHPTIWELKTAKRRWTRDQLAYDLQPTCYGMARVHDIDDATVKMIITTKARQPEVQVETVCRNGGDEIDLAWTAASVLRAIAAGVDRPLRGWQCKSCQYAGSCA